MIVWVEHSCASKEYGIISKMCSLLIEYKVILMVFIFRIILEGYRLSLLVVPYMTEEFILVCSQLFSFVILSLVLNFVFSKFQELQILVWIFWMVQRVWHHAIHHKQHSIYQVCQHHLVKVATLNRCKDLNGKHSLSDEVPHYQCGLFKSAFSRSWRCLFFFSFAFIILYYVSELLLERWSLHTVDIFSDGVWLATKDL